MSELRDIEVIEIPNWCSSIFDEEQEDPDKDPGFLVIAKLWSAIGTLLFQGEFMFTGQDDHTLFGPSIATGKVHRCIVQWKGHEIDAKHDMHEITTYMGRSVTLALHNLRQMT